MSLVKDIKEKKKMRKKDEKKRKKIKKIDFLELCRGQPSAYENLKFLNFFEFVF